VHHRTSGRINLGLRRHAGDGRDERLWHLLFIGSPWLGVLAAGITGALLGALHAGHLFAAAVNDVAVASR